MIELYTDRVGSGALLDVARHACWIEGLAGELFSSWVQFDLYEAQL